MYFPKASLKNDTSKIKDYYNLLTVKGKEMLIWSWEIALKGLPFPGDGWH
jgi:hypothetical protein